VKIISFDLKPLGVSPSKTEYTAGAGASRSFKVCGIRGVQAMEPDLDHRKLIWNDLDHSGVFQTFPNFFKLSLVTGA